MRSMSTQPGSHRALRMAALGSGGVLTAGAAAVSVLVAQGVQARRTVGPRRTVPPYSDGRYGGREGVSLRLCILGDSLATGLGVSHPHDTPGALLAVRYAGESARPVILTTVASVGARSEHLAEQVDRALIVRPTVAVIIIGANDVTHLVPQRRSVRLLRDAVVRLREAGSVVIVGTCPDLGTVQPIRRPLRHVVRRLSRQLARAQTTTAVLAGAHTVSLGDLLGPEFAARPLELFSDDHFHPNEEGYAALADVLGDGLLAATGLRGMHLPVRYEPLAAPALARAAEEAVASPGTVVGSELAGEGGRRRWRRLIRVPSRASRSVAGGSQADPAMVE